MRASRIAVRGVVLRRSARKMRGEMRVDDGTTEPVGPEIEFTFNGRAFKGRAGETIAAAVIAAGEHGLRIAKDGTRRGVFCGMGVCQECLVSVDGAA
ncbi:MAG: (2Fe-2S)-binding protein, partial [Alphaproteobacteria bacterium]|nr:(2Fe-2S)-binding protein [Alphaproteobacteria bacterium]